MAERDIIPMRPSYAPTPRYVMLVDGRDQDCPCRGSYVAALVIARTGALGNPGRRYELLCDGQMIARYMARGGKLVEAVLA